MTLAISKQATCRRPAQSSTWLLVATQILIFAVGCSGENPGNNSNEHTQFAHPVISTGNLDILWVIDNSESMADEITLWADAHFSGLDWLGDVPGSRPDLHIGVTTSDLGAGSAAVGGCSESGTNGRLVGQNCLTSPTRNYLIDVKPQSCDIEEQRDAGRLVGCLSHNCGIQNCQHEIETTLVVGADGCPRCRNFGDQTLQETISCMTNVGTSGCEFGQPLEAVHKALTSSDNPGFLRESSHLSIAITTDSDDCSAKSLQLFDDSATDLNSELGPLTPFRCFEFGISCNTNDRATFGIRTNCQVVADDNESLLHPVSRYTDLLLGLRSPYALSVSVLTGPTNNMTAIVEQNADGYPELGESCTTTLGGAKPGFRLEGFVSSLQLAGVLMVQTSSICDASAEDQLHSLGQQTLFTVSPFNCIPRQLSGCTDIDAWFGHTGDGQQCNDTCSPTCDVFAVLEQSTPNEATVRAPRCLHILKDGSIDERNLDRSLAYQDGSPPPVDANLPEPLCWYIALEEHCATRSKAELRISMREMAGSDSYLVAKCAATNTSEQICDDGLDNDEDCLIDREDPDCASE